MASVNSPQYAGVQAALKVSWSDLEAVLDDLEGEQESMPAAEPNDLEPDLDEVDIKEQNSDGLDNLKESILNASRGVTEDTDKQYRKCACIITRYT